MKQYTAELIEKIKTTSPLIHNITNFVVMNSSANILLAIGASPVMAHCLGEVEEMTSLASEDARTRGVDSLLSVTAEIIDAAQKLASDMDAFLKVEIIK